MSKYTKAIFLAVLFPALVYLGVSWIDYEWQDILDPEAPTMEGLRCLVLVASMCGFAIGGLSHD